MAHVFAMPMLGQTMEEGTIVQWFKQEGDAVKEGEILLEVMSDKASFEVESPAGGIVRKVLAAANDSVPVHTPIAIIGAADEAIDGLVAAPGTSPAAAGPAPAAAPTSAAAAAVAAPAPPAAVPAGPVAISPRARRIADQHGVAIASLAGAGTGPGGRVIERDVLAFVEQQAAAAAAGHVRVTPLAAKIAGDLGVDATAVAAAPGARVTADDVRRGAEAARPAAPAAAATPAAAPGEPIVADTIPFRGMRKMVADTVTKSRHTAPHVCASMEVDMTELVALHARLQPEVLRAHETKLTYTDLIIKAIALALRDHPLCNAALIGDEIRLYGERNIGVAVAGDGSLVVPVIRNADDKPLHVISKELKSLAGRAREGKSTAEDLAGGTFTITNIGIFGVDSFDPILVPPQSCILGVCRIAEKPVVKDKQVVIRSMMNLCLSFDHRVLDGAPAARFLLRLKELVESPLLILL